MQIRHCVNCKQLLFNSATKYDSHTGWPAFWDLANPDAVKSAVANSFDITRTEVMCAHFGPHLGHVFPDGPHDKTGLRYCINSLALEFQPNK